MSTVYKNSTAIRIAILARSGQTVFHTRDLGNYWGITDMNLLYTTLKRYSKQGLLFRIYKGMYSLIPVEKIDRYLLGVKAMHGYCYVSMESVLSMHGIINQIPQAHTLVGSVSLQFSIGTFRYVCRKLADRFLFSDYGISRNSNGVAFASIERAIADLLYFRPLYYFDGIIKIDWGKVNELQRIIGYPIIRPKDI